MSIAILLLAFLYMIFVSWSDFDQSEEEPPKWI